MNKKILIPLIFTVALILTATGAVILAEKSGLAINTTSNSTWGEKQISLDAINVLNNSTQDTFEYNNTKYTYLEGYVKNSNEYDAFHVKMNATAYDQSGNVVATNDSIYLQSKNIPGNGESYFGVSFPDQDSKIRKIEVHVVDARAEL